MIKFIPPFAYKGHSLYATLIERGTAVLTIPTPPRWQGYLDNKPLRQWEPKLDESADDVKQRLREEAEAWIRSRD